MNVTPNKNPTEKKQASLPGQNRANPECFSVRVNSLLQLTTTGGILSFAAEIAMATAKSERASIRLVTLRWHAGTLNTVAATQQQEVVRVVFRSIRDEEIAETYGRSAERWRGIPTTKRSSLQT